MYKRDGDNELAKVFLRNGHPKFAMAVYILKKLPGLLIAVSALGALIVSAERSIDAPTVVKPFIALLRLGD